MGAMLRVDPWAWIIRLLAALAISILVLGLMLAVLLRDGEQVSVTELWVAVTGAWRPAVLAYAALQLIQAWLRALRYSALIRAGGETVRPGFGPLLSITLTRNMLVDLLPARAGEWVYAGMINRGCGARGEHALSSMGLSIYFDVFALLLVLSLALGQSAGAAWLWGAVVSWAAIVVAGWLVLFHGAGALWRAIGRRWSLEARGSRIRRAHLFVGRLIGSVEQVNRSGLLVRVLVLSAAIRLVKYAALYGLFYGVTRGLWPGLAKAPISSVVTALIAAEASASLPIPAFMSFGTYEAGGWLALTALGFPSRDSMLAMLAMHVVSQAVDYLWGGLALAFFVLRVWGGPAHVQAKPEGEGRILRWRSLALAMAMAAVVTMSLFYTGRQWLRFRRSGAGFRAQGHGQPVEMPEAERARRIEMVRGLEGFVVWSSNRAGQHDLWMLTFPHLEVRRLTEHPHAETYPRISPDGRCIVFCRSKLPQVSQRDPVPWMICLLELETGDVRILSEDGFTPSWSEDGATVVFVRGGRAIIEMNPETAEERVLYAAGQGDIPDGVIFQTPDWRRTEERLAVTIRGRRRDTWILGPGERRVRVGSGRGCQVNWSPDGAFVYYVDHGGRGGNTIFRADSQGGDPRPWLDLPLAWSHEYFPRLSPDGRYLVMAASAEGHEHDVADYELFLWPVGAPEEAVVRLTYHTGNDCWPDIFLVRREPEEAFTNP